MDIEKIDYEELRKYYYEPYEFGKYKVFRRVFILEKSGFLGKIGEMRLLDFVVFNIEPEELIEMIKPIPNVMIQRFLFPGKGKMVKKSFLLGLRGWAYIGFLEGEEKFFEDMRNELRKSMKE